jgi:hypothetical protein
MTDTSEFIKGTTSLVGMGLVAGVGLSVMNNTMKMTNNIMKSSQPRKRVVRRKKVVHHRRKK